MIKKFIIILLLFLIFLLILGFLIPQKITMPVVGATSADYNPNTFWYYPWGKSITHKGIDVFAKTGTPIVSSSIGVVISVKESRQGGKSVTVLGPKWRFHYYAHLDEIKVKKFSFVTSKRIIGTVGSTGNAVGKPPHLHYSIITPIPYIWRKDNSIQGHKKMYYLNPLDYLK